MRSFADVSHMLRELAPIEPVYGIFWELRFKGHDRYPAMAYSLSGRSKFNGHYSDMVVTLDTD